MKSINLRILLPEKVFFKGKVDFLTTSTTEGELTLLPDHVDCILKLTPGLLYFHADGAKNSYFITYGTLRLEGDNCNITLDKIIEPSLLKESLSHMRRENIFSKEELDQIENKLEYIYNNMRA